MGQEASTSSDKEIEVLTHLVDGDTEDDMKSTKPADDEAGETTISSGMKEEVDDNRKEMETAEAEDSNDTKNQMKDGAAVKDEEFQEETEEKKEEDADAAVEGHNQEIVTTKPDEDGVATNLASDEGIKAEGSDELIKAEADEAGDPEDSNVKKEQPAEKAADTKDSNTPNVAEDNTEAEGSGKSEQLEVTDKKEVLTDDKANHPETAPDLSRDPSNMPHGSIPHAAPWNGAAFGGYYGHHMYGMYPPPYYGYPYPPPHLHHPAQVPPHIQHHPHAVAGVIPPEYAVSPTRAGPYAAHHHADLPPRSPVVAAGASKNSRPPLQDDREQNSEEGEEGEDGSNKNPTNLKVYYKTTQSVSKEVIDRRSRKNSQSRSRAAKFRDRIAEIERKPEDQRTDEERGMYDLYQERRKRKNDRSRERALEKKEEIDRILAKPEKKRTRIEISFLQNALGAKKRKNEGDRLRRSRIKELGMSKTNSAGKPGIPARGPLPPPYENRLMQWHQGYGAAPPPMMHPPPYYNPEHVPGPHPGSPGGVPGAHPGSPP